MATELIEGAKRTDMWFVNPNDVHLKESNRGRRFRPTDDELLSLAADMHEHGQIMPVLVRRIGARGQEHIHVVAGFTRTAAARLIRTGFKYGGMEYEPRPDFMLQVKNAGAMNDTDALTTNIRENLKRKEPNVIDDAHNQARLRDQSGWDDARIAALYGCSKKLVQDRQRLLELDEHTQLLVATKAMSLEAAELLLALEPEARTAELEKAKETTGKVNTTRLRAAVREEAWADQPAIERAEQTATNAPGPAGPATNGTPSTNGSTAPVGRRVQQSKRSRPEIMKSFATAADAVDASDDEMKFIGNFQRFANGQMAEKTFWKYIGTVFPRVTKEKAAEKAAAK